MTSLLFILAVFSSRAFAESTPPASHAQFRVIGDIAGDGHYALFDKEWPMAGNSFFIDDESAFKGFSQTFITHLESLLKKALIEKGFQEARDQLHANLFVMIRGSRSLHYETTDQAE